jgi:hypothetical protein
MIHAEVSHFLPNVMRANDSLMRFRLAGSEVALNSSASLKNLFFFSASMLPRRIGAFQPSGKS